MSDASHGWRKYVGTMSLCLTPEIMKKVQEEAKLRKIKNGQVLRLIVEEWFAQKEKACDSKQP